jgi:cytochrome c oxidase subunit 2
MRTQVIVHEQQDFDAWMNENQIADNQEMNHAVAMNSENLSPSEFLAPYTDNLDVNPATLKSLVMSH